MQKVYVIGQEGGPVKIGIARDPVRRLVELQTGCPFQLSLLHVEEVESEAAPEVETFVHSALSAKALRGEWFGIAPSEAVSAIRSFGTERDRRGAMLTPRQSKAARVLLGFGQEELAKRAKLAKRTVMDFESGARQAGIGTRTAIAHALRESGVELLQGEGVALREH